MARQRVTRQEAVSMIRLRLDFRASSMTGYTNYEGDFVIKSYDTEVARITAEGVAWVTTNTYTMTTAQHLSYIRRGLAGFDVIHAPTLEQAKGTTKWRDLSGVLA